jgi:hypothetical protein
LLLLVQNIYGQKVTEYVKTNHYKYKCAYCGKIKKEDKVDVASIKNPVISRNASAYGIAMGLFSSNFAQDDKICDISRTGNHRFELVSKTITKELYTANSDNQNKEEKNNELKNENQEFDYAAAEAASLEFEKKEKNLNKIKNENQGFNYAAAKAASLEFQKNQKKSLDFFEYIFYNECTDTSKSKYRFYIDDKQYKYGRKIKLQEGRHKVKEKLYTEGGEIYLDSSFVDLDDENFKIELSLNCACPFFFYKIENNEIFGGEIIRNQNSNEKDLFGSSEIKKEYLNGESLLLVIKEEKNETSYIDNIYILLNDTIKIYPICIDGNTQKLINAADNKYAIMNKGDYFNLRFEIPKNLNIQKSSIVSKGYYLKND